MRQTECSLAHFSYQRVCQYSHPVMYTHHHTIHTHTQPHTIILSTPTHNHTPSYYPHPHTHNHTPSYYPHPHTHNHTPSYYPHPHTIILCTNTHTSYYTHTHTHTRTHTPCDAIAGTLLVVDETQLSPGQLNEQGVKNLAALCHLSRWQRVYYDFRYYSTEFSCDIVSITCACRVVTLPHSFQPIMIFSEGRSIIKVITLASLHCICKCCTSLQTHTPSTCFCHSLSHTSTLSPHLPLTTPCSPFSTSHTHCRTVVKFRWIPLSLPPQGTGQ